MHRLTNRMQLTAAKIGSMRCRLHAIDHSGDAFVVVRLGSIDPGVRARNAKATVPIAFDHAFSPLLSSPLHLSFAKLIIHSVIDIPEKHRVFKTHGSIIYEAAIIDL